jgi:hypothetical protein
MNSERNEADDEQFLVNTDRLVMVKIKPGKHYITQPGVDLLQPSQKGGTCWYYSLSFLRPRIGSQGDALTGEQPEKLIQMRKVEKRISNFRKELTKITEEKDRIVNSIDRLESLKRIEKTKSLPDAELHRLYESGALKMNAGLNEVSQSLLEEFEKFRKTKFKSFADYLENRTVQCNEQLKVIPIKEKDVREKFAEELSGINSRESALTTKKTFTIAVMEAYQLKTSEWHPANGITGLIAALQKEGPLSVAGAIGSGYYANPPQKLTKNEVVDKHCGNHYELFSWKPTDGFDANKHAASHAVTIIGAQRGTTKKPDDGYVFFIDSNDQSKPDEKRKVYQISFKRLISALSPLNDKKVRTSTNQDLTLNEFKEIQGPFAICGNAELKKEAEEEYQKSLKFPK